MTKTSIIIPANNERFLIDTVNSAFSQASGDIEVIVILDGPSTFGMPEDRPGLIKLTNASPKGIRKSINAGIDVATGKYLLKADAHCMFHPGYDEILKKDCDEDWLVVPRCVPIDGERDAFELIWDSEGCNPVIDYFYLSCPWTHPKMFQMQSCPWIDRTQDRYDIAPIDELMTFQGSLWFAHTDYWRKHIGPLFEEGFGECCEHQEIGFKYWLGGGKVFVNKKLWYGHDHRTNRRRGYHRPISQFHLSHIYVARYWTANKWPKQIHTFEWLIDKFWPLPVRGHTALNQTYIWPENWKEVAALGDRSLWPKSR